MVKWKQAMLSAVISLMELFDHRVLRWWKTILKNVTDNNYRKSVLTNDDHDIKEVLKTINLEDIMYFDFIVHDMSVN